jgi:hypothetical protein
MVASLTKGDAHKFFLSGYSAIIQAEKNIVTMKTIAAEIPESS